MRKVIMLCLVAVLAFPAVAMATGKVGVINMGKVFKDSEPGKAAMDGLKTKFESMKKDLEKQKNDLDKMRNDLQNQSMALSLEARQDKDMEFKRKVRDFQDLSQNYQRKMQAEEDKASEPIIKVLADVIKEYGKKNGYDLIFDQDGRTSSILYMNDAVDMTNDIIVELNKAWKAGKR